jgi:hypothetical protein
MDDSARAPRSLLEEGAELDATVAGAVMRWTCVGGHLWRDAYGTVYYTGQDPASVGVPHVVFQPSRDALYATWVEEQLRRVGTHAAYVAALIEELALGTRPRGRPRRWAWRCMRSWMPRQRSGAGRHCGWCVMSAHNVGAGCGACDAGST